MTDCTRRRISVCTTGLHDQKKKLTGNDTAALNILPLSRPSLFICLINLTAKMENTLGDRARLAIISLSPRNRRVLAQENGLPGSQNQISVTGVGNALESLININLTRNPGHRRTFRERNASKRSDAAFHLEFERASVARGIGESPPRNHTCSLIIPFNYPPHLVHWSC